MLYLTSEDVAVLATVTLYSFLGDVITNCNKLTDSFVLITSCLCGKGTHALVEVRERPCVEPVLSSTTRWVPGSESSHQT